jgi:hypothetical protein
MRSPVKLRTWRFSKLRLLKNRRINGSSCQTSLIDAYAHCANRRDAQGTDDASFNHLVEGNYSHRIPDHNCAFEICSAYGKTRVRRPLNRTAGFSSWSDLRYGVVRPRFGLSDRNTAHNGNQPQLLGEGYRDSRLLPAGYDRPVRAHELIGEGRCPDDVYAFAKTTDGFLWLGTMQGLCRRSSIRCADAGSLPFPRACMLVFCRV